MIPCQKHKYASSEETFLDKGRLIFLSSKNEDFQVFGDEAEGHMIPAPEKDWEPQRIFSSSNSPVCERIKFK